MTEYVLSSMPEIVSDGIWEDDRSRSSRGILKCATNLQFRRALADDYPRGVNARAAASTSLRGALTMKLSPLAAECDE